MKYPKIDNLTCAYKMIDFSHNLRNKGRLIGFYAVFWHNCQLMHSEGLLNPKKSQLLKQYKTTV